MRRSWSALTISGVGISSGVVDRATSPLPNELVPGWGGTALGSGVQR